MCETNINRHITCNVVNSNHVSNFVISLSEFYVSEGYLDVEFACKHNVSVRTNKLLLISVSEFLKEILNSDCDCEIARISVPDIESDAVEILITFLREGMTKVNLNQLVCLKELLILFHIKLENTEVFPETIASATPQVSENVWKNGKDSSFEKIFLEEGTVYIPEKKKAKLMLSDEISEQFPQEKRLSFNEQVEQSIKATSVTSTNDFGQHFLCDDIMKSSVDQNSEENVDFVLNKNKTDINLHEEMPQQGISEEDSLFIDEFGHSIEYPSHGAGNSVEEYLLPDDVIKSAVKCKVENNKELPMVMKQEGEFSELTSEDMNDNFENVFNDDDNFLNAEEESDVKKENTVGDDEVINLEDSNNDDTIESMHQKIKRKIPTSDNMTVLPSTTKMFTELSTQYTAEGSINKPRNVLREHCVKFSEYLEIIHGRTLTITEKAILKNAFIQDCSVDVFSKRLGIPYESVLHWLQLRRKECSSNEVIGLPDISKESSVVTNPSTQSGYAEQGTSSTSSKTTYNLRSSSNEVTGLPSVSKESSVVTNPSTQSGYAEQGTSSTSSKTNYNLRSSKNTKHFPSYSEESESSSNSSRKCYSLRGSKNAKNFPSFSEVSESSSNSSRKCYSLKEHCRKFYEYLEKISGRNLTHLEKYLLQNAFIHNWSAHEFSERFGILYEYVYLWFQIKKKNCPKHGTNSCIESPRPLTMIPGSTMKYQRILPKGSERQMSPKRSEKLPKRSEEQSLPKQSEQSNSSQIADNTTSGLTLLTVPQTPHPPPPLPQPTPAPPPQQPPVIVPPVVVCPMPTNVYPTINELLNFPSGSLNDVSRLSTVSEASGNNIASGQAEQKTLNNSAYYNLKSSSKDEKALPSSSEDSNINSEFSVSTAYTELVSSSNQTQTYFFTPSTYSQSSSNNATTGCYSLAGQKHPAYTCMEFPQAGSAMVPQAGSVLLPRTPSKYQRILPKDFGQNNSNQITENKNKNKNPGFTTWGVPQSPQPPPQLPQPAPLPLPPPQQQPVIVPPMAVCPVPAGVFPTTNESLNFPSGLTLLPAAQPQPIMMIPPIVFAMPPNDNKLMQSNFYPGSASITNTNSFCYTLGGNAQDLMANKVPVSAGTYYIAGTEPSKTPSNITSSVQHIVADSTTVTTSPSALE